MQIRFICTLALVSCFMIASASLGFAEPPQGGPQGGGQGGGPREACRQDAHKFCSGVQPGGGRIKNCLESHHKEVSDACYDAMQNAASKGPPPPPPQHNSSGEGGEESPPPQD